MRKLLTLILMFSLICGTNTENSSALWWSAQPITKANICEEKNKCGLYKNLDCAISYMKKMLPIKSYEELRDIGKNCEYRLYLWDYSRVQEFPRVMSQELEINQNGFTINAGAKNITKEIGGLFGIDKALSNEVLLKFLSDTKYKTLSEDQLTKLIADIISEARRDENPANTIGLLGGVAGSAAGAAFAVKVLALATGGALGGAVIGFLGIGGLCRSAVSWWKDSDRDKKMKQHWIEIQNYASSLEQLLDRIKNEDWREADSVLAEMDFTPDSYKAVVAMINSDVEYTDKLKRRFAQKFKDLAGNLTLIVDRNKPWRENTK